MLRVLSSFGSVTRTTEMEALFSPLSPMSPNHRVWSGPGAMSSQSRALTPLIVITALVSQSRLTAKKRALSPLSLCRNKTLRL